MKKILIEGSSLVHDDRFLMIKMSLAVFAIGAALIKLLV
jgi:hypothetical protein